MHKNEYQTSNCFNLFVVYGYFDIHKYFLQGYIYQGQQYPFKKTVLIYFERLFESQLYLISKDFTKITINTSLFG